MEDVDELLEALESLDSWIYSLNLVGLNILLLHPLLSTALFQVLYAHSFGRFLRVLERLTFSPNSMK